MAWNIFSSRKSNRIAGFLNERHINTISRREDLFFRQKFSELRTLHSKDLVAHFGCVNAIEFSNGSGEIIASGI